MSSRGLNRAVYDDIIIISIITIRGARSGCNRAKHESRIPILLVYQDLDEYQFTIKHKLMNQWTMIYCVQKVYYSFKRHPIVGT